VLKRKLFFERWTLVIFLVAMMGLGFLSGSGLGRASSANELVPAKLLVNLPEYCNTPDGMALDNQKNIILSCPNFNNRAYPALLLKIDHRSQISIFFVPPVQPDTQRAGPMGLEFDPAGNLYIADNQYFSDKNHKSRLLKVVFRNGKPERTVLVASGLMLSNAVRVRDGYVYLSDTVLLEDSVPLVSGVYRFRLDEEGVVVQPGTEDPHLIATIQTQNRTLRFGADGMAFDREGNLYLGNFADGLVHKLTIGPDGHASTSLYAQSPDMQSADGLLSDSGGNIYVADLKANAVHVIRPGGKVQTIARNGDTDGSDGSLDGPCEAILRDNELIIANFDTPFEGCVNKKFDEPHTLSVIRLKK
jgi:DNA-binding beta-propeller fold protein YncE